MNAKILIACLLTTAFVPVASASTDACLWQSSLDHGACADAAGYSYGAGCGGAQSETVDDVHVTTYGPRGWRSVGATWSCDDWSYVGANNTTAPPSHARSLRVASSSYRDGTWRETSLDWTSYDNGAWHGCGTYLTTPRHGRDLGCPAGEPPAPVAILP